MVASDAGSRVRRGGAAVACLALGGLLFRDLLAFDPRRLDPDGLLEWFATPNGLWLPLVLAGAARLAWRRRSAWRALPERSGATPGVACFGAGLLAALWSRLTGVGDLLVWSFGLAAAAAFAWRRGAAGVRVMAVPLLFLLFAVAPPPRLVGETLWWIQTVSARAATALVQSFDAPALGEGIVVTTPTEVFGIVESCAALGILVLLTAGAVLARDRIARAGPRSWLLVAAAPAVALAVNLLRISAIVARPELNALHHLGQWAILLGVGTALLAGLAALLVRGAPRTAPRSARAAGTAAPLPSVVALAGVGALALVSLLPVPQQARPVPAPVRAIPMEHAGWAAREVAIDRLFLGFVQFRKIVARRYERGDDVVDLFVGDASWRSEWSSPFSPKTILPGLRWVPLPGAPPAAPDLPRTPSQTALVARDGRRWWVAQWRFGDPGVAAESLRQLFALDASPFGERRIRRVVRIAAPVDGSAPGDLESARGAISGFAWEFAFALFDEPLIGEETASAFQPRSP